MQKQWFTPESERKKADSAQIRFEVRPLTRLESWDVRDHVMALPNGGAVFLATGRKLAARLGVTDWAGVQDAAGQPVPFPAGDLEAMLAHVDVALLDAAALEVLALTHPKEDARKN